MAISECVPDIILERLHGMVQKKCWYVSAGGAAGSTFELSFGDKVSRKIPVNNSAQTQEFRDFEGEISLLVWCSWRLDGESEPIISSAESADDIDDSLQILLGKEVLKILVRPPAWDLDITFSHGLILRVFCDNISEDVSNWFACNPSEILFTGPGYKWGLTPQL